MLANTDWLYPKTNNGSSILIPIILSLKRRTHIYSQHCFIAENSKPNENVSTLVCFLEKQWMEVLLRRIIYPLLDIQVIVSLALYESKKYLMVIPIPLYLGVLGGSSSLNYPYEVSDQYSLGNLDKSISVLVGSNPIRLFCFDLIKSNI